MNDHQSIIDAVAAAVMYEGYLLYPYRQSIKNRQRWTFGGLFPPAYADAGESSTLQSQCLVKADRGASVTIRVRFLQLIERQIGKLVEPAKDWPPTDLVFDPVDQLVVGKQEFHKWQEAREREIQLRDMSLEHCLTVPQQQPFKFSSARWLEPIRGDDACVAVFIREQHDLQGVVTVSAAALPHGVNRLTVSVENQSTLANPTEATRACAQLRSLAATHLILSVANGEFVSQIDPPEDLRLAAAACHNQGTWPVLIGQEGRRDSMLAAPIILYDYPQVAAESPGDLFDGTEIDEILTLRVQTLTDNEKRAVASLETAARTLLMRTDSLTSEAFGALHETLRPVS